ncbi:replication initiator protein A [Streptococcus suis]|uniref:replication initiator protein A n=1 Tax=Streptococcus suis TaxID=1307 RepID=UPI001ABDBBB4|nr:replication initiator protein A [Streptococcus suis]
MVDLKDFTAITVEQMDTSEIYYSIPKALIEDEKYLGLRMDSKMMYGILKDRLKLSIMNGWVDEEGRPYLEYSNRELQELFNCSKHTVITIKKNLAEHGLILEVSQYTKADGQVSNRIYLGNVIRYDAEKMRQRRAERQAQALEKRQSKRLDTPRAKFAPGVDKNLTGGVQDSDTNKYLPSINESSKGINSSRKAEGISEEIPQPSGAGDQPYQNQSGGYIKPEYYSLLQVIADRYNDRLFCFPDVVTMTHRQKMQVGRYLEEGYLTYQEVLDVITRIPEDCQSPLAYLFRSLDNLKDERRLEAKILAHKKALVHYGD